MFPMHGGFMGRKKGVDPCAYVPGLYTQAEVDDLINIDGYIPVADADEFDLIRTGAVETMGGCSIWAGSYTTGVDKQYIQIFDIDMTGVSHDPVGNASGQFTGLYDGNDFTVSDLIYSGAGILRYALFDVLSGATLQNIKLRDFDINHSSGENARIASALCTAFIGECLVENIDVQNAVVEMSNTGVGENRTAIICGVITSSSTNSIIDNVIVNNSTVISRSTGSTGLIGQGIIIGAQTAATGDQITNCEVTNCAITSAQNFSGGIAGAIHSTISDCKVRNLTITRIVSVTLGNFYGGIVGQQFAGTVINCSATGTIEGRFGVGGCIGFINVSGANIEECWADVQVTGEFTVGGFIGGLRQNSTVRDCYAYGDAIRNGGTLGVGGFVGEMRTSNPQIINSYSTGSAIDSASPADVGGFCGLRTNGTVTASYWDTVASGNATSAAGTGQTTVALQTPTTPSGIYAAWNSPPWDFGTDTEYPTLTTTP